MMSRGSSSPIDRRTVVGPDAGLGELGGGQVAVGHRCRVCHEAAGVADVRDEPHDLEARR